MEKSTTGGSAPPYDQNPPYTNLGSTPAQPTMHHDAYNQPTSPPPQVFSPQHTQQSSFPPYHDPNAIQQQQQQQQQPLGSPGQGQYDQQKGSYYPQQQQQQQAPQYGIPMQAQNQSQYHTAMPLQNLTEGAAPVDCPACRQRALTRTEYVSGNTTMGWAAAMCICLCLGCIPFIMRSLKDVEHHCGKCGVLLATWHNSGRVVVHQHM